MIKNEEMLEEQYPEGMNFLLDINTYIMDIYDEENREYETYADLAKFLADRISTPPENIPSFQKTIDDLKKIAATEMDSWEEIKAYVNIWFEDANDTKNWLEAEVIPVLEAEGRKRGWIK